MRIGSSPNADNDKNILMIIHKTRLRLPLRKLKVVYMCIARTWAINHIN